MERVVKTDRASDLLDLPLTADQPPLRLPHLHRHDELAGRAAEACRQRALQGSQRCVELARQLLWRDGFGDPRIQSLYRAHVESFRVTGRHVGLLPQRGYDRRQATAKSLIRLRIVVVCCVTGTVSLAGLHMPGRIIPQCVELPETSQQRLDPFSVSSFSPDEQRRQAPTACKRRNEENLGSAHPCLAGQGAGVDIPR